MDHKLSHTNLCLILKNISTNWYEEFRTIALCHVSYKIITKVLVNRLKTHMDSIISDNQNAFIPRRMISGNIVIVHEVFHSLKARKRQATLYMAVMTDNTKAYERLEWAFLSKTMPNMGFDQRWINWIMTCVTAIIYSVLINGTQEEFITPARGLRQGNPLLPYLFIFCAEVLSRRMMRAMLNRSLMGVRISNNAPAVNHLLFTDDSLFFTLANEKAAKKLMHIVGVKIGQ